MASDELDDSTKMASGQKFGYQQTLIYGRYTRDLGSFAKYQAKRLKREAKQFEQPKPIRGIWVYLERLAVWRDFVCQKIGEDWLFLALLGILMAVVSFMVDYVIEQCMEAKYWLYKELAFSVALQYFVWVSYSILLILFSVGFTHIVSPQAIGSGIPEMKVILRGVVLKEYLTFRTLVSKVVGLSAAIGSTLPIGKEGPFVHISSMLATVLSKGISSFQSIYENESRRSEMLAAACAVGVAATFSAPIGGVLFSIEVTATYFAVRNYWRGFFSAVCGALTFQLLGLWFKNAETLTALFKTNLRTEFPFDVRELFAFAFIGVACGFIGVLFILCHRRYVYFLRRQKKLSAFLQRNRFIYPGVVTLLISSLTFPPGFGQFFGGVLTGRQAVNELFSNITWTTGQADDLDDEAILHHWKHPLTNIYVTLVLYFINAFWMTILCLTMPIPAGVFVPVFVIGACFGRLVGESMAAWYPAGIRSGDIVRKIVPGAYAVVGAASLSGSVTRTVSTAVIVFELTGQISHVLPAVLAVLIANAVANMFQPSFFDSIIRIRGLPYLPDIIRANNSWSIFVEDFMVRDVKFVHFSCTYQDIYDLLHTSYFRSYPLVDSADSMILLGSIQRYELERILWMHLSHDQVVNMEGEGALGGQSPVVVLDSGRSTPTIDLVEEVPSRPVTPPASSPPPAPSAPSGPTPRFVVSRVEEGAPMPGAQRPAAKPEAIQMKLLKPPGEGVLDAAQGNYNTLQLPLRGPLRSILKKSPSSPSLQRRGSTGSLRADVDKYYKRLANTKKESIVEDRPFYLQKGSIASLNKKVKLPPSAVKVKHLAIHEQEEWECQQLLMDVDWEDVQIDPAPFQLVERTSLHKVHSMFSLLGLNHAFVTNTGKLVGIVGLAELRAAIQGNLDAEKERKARRKAGIADPEEDNPERLVVEESEGEKFTLVREDPAPEGVPYADEDTASQLNGRNPRENGEAQV